MKTSILIIILLTGGMITFAQTNRYNQPARSNYQNTYVSPDFNLMIKALNDRQALFDQNRAATDALINWIFELKSQTNEKQFIDAMNSYYQRLRAFDNQDFSLLSNQIRSIELGIKEEIDKYNTRIKEANETQTTKADDASGYWNEAMNNIKNQDYRSALINMTSCIQLSPGVAAAYALRGWVLLQMESHGSAIDDYTKAIELNPSEPSSYYYRAIIYYRLSDLNRLSDINSSMSYLNSAMSDINQCIKLWPYSADAYLIRGLMKSELKDHYGAISDNEKAIELDPTFSMAYNNMGWAKFNQKKYKEALIDVNKAIELDNTNSVAYDSRAEIKFYLNDYYGCIADADRALRLDPQLSNPYFLKGRACYRLGEKYDACMNWMKAGELGNQEANDYISKYCK